MQKGFTAILLLVGVLVLAVTAGGAYYFSKTSAKPIQQPVTQQVTTPAPQPTVDETANWKTYMGTLGYSFRYPNAFQIKDFTSSDISSLKETINMQIADDSITNTQSLLNNWISVWDNLGIQVNDLVTRKQWCDRLEPQLTGQLDCAHGNNFSVIDVNGYRAYQSKGGRDASIVRTLYIAHGDYVYEISLSDGDPEKLELQELNNQILSTFKFLDQASTAKDCAKLDSNLYQLSKASNPESFAASHAIYYKDGKARAVIELISEGKDLTKQFDLNIESIYGNLIQALIPKDVLCELSNDSVVRTVRIPTPTTSD